MYIVYIFYAVINLSNYKWRNYPSYSNSLQEKYENVKNLLLCKPYYGTISWPNIKNNFCF